MRLRHAIAACVLIAFGSFGIENAALAANRYQNSTYGFAVELPPGTIVETTRPPAPQHGVAMPLGNGRRIWIDASYDAQFLGSARAALNELARDEHVPARTPVKKTLLAKFAALRMDYLSHRRAAARIIAYRPRGTEVAIIYTVGLDTDRGHAAIDKRILSQVLASFVVRPTP